ncbi:MAG: glycosyltransferase family 39 protein, partial [Methanobacteriota archaeon]
MMFFRGAGRYLIIFALMLSLFVLFSLAVIYEYPPVWPDETVFADTAYELAFNGRLATPVWSYIAEGMGERAVWYPPVHFILLGGVYRLFGFGILQTRLLSLFFSTVLVASLFLVSLKVTGGNKRASLLVAGLLVVDPVFIRGAIIGRGDVIAVSLMVLGLLCYLSYRRHVLAGSLIGFSVMTQLIGVFGFVAIFLVSFLDKDRKKILACITIPAILIFSAWGIYALMDVGTFISQFSGQIGEKTGIQPSDILFFMKFYVETYFFSAPNWLRNGLSYYIVLACFTVLFTVSAYHLIKNRSNKTSLIVAVFFFSQIIAYNLGRHGMW